MASILEKVIATAAAYDGLTPASFDYALATGDSARAILGNAAYRLVKGTGDAGKAGVDGVLEEITPEVEARAAYAKTLRYLNWSNYREDKPLAYADPEAVTPLLAEWPAPNFEWVHSDLYGAGKRFNDQPGAVQYDNGDGTYSVQIWD